MLALAGAATGLLLAMQLGDTMRAAYQELVSMMVLCAFMPYFYIFGSAWKAGLRMAPACGILITSLALLFTAIPTEDVANVWLFEGKIWGGAVVTLGLGRWIFSRTKRGL